MTQNKALSATKENIEAIKNIFQLKDAIDLSAKKDTTLLASSLIFGSVALNSSDIHLEPESDKVRIRARVDGVLHDISSLSRETYEGLLSRLKLFSGLKLNVRTKPQDGRFTVEAGEENIEIRASVLPSEFGETIVMRLLNPKNLVSIEELGLGEDVLAILKEEIQKPNGMIIVTGPTGSGKTTTLYAILSKINRPEAKIITIEDPIEYHLKGISQSQVEPERGYDFATGLSTIVRQDPDVILVGEIRDPSTAKISIQAAMTGHLVLTTLHTNDAAGTIARLQALGEKASNISPALNLSIAQRLVRKVCPKCVVEKTISEEEAAIFSKGLGGLKAKNLPKIAKTTKIPKIKGCDFCNGTGYKNRTGIYEFFLIDDVIENFIAQNPTVAQIQAKAVERGMITMRQDGLIKVLRGITTLEEVQRETGR